MSTIEFESAQHVKVEYELASTLQRVAGSMIDVVMFIIYFVILNLVLGLSNIFASTGSELFFTLLVIKLPWILYNPVIEYITHGQSLGKYIMGIRVVRLKVSVQVCVKSLPVGFSKVILYGSALIF
jgi:uncharacterized RDD family membrane protein YckC